MSDEHDYRQGVDDITAMMDELQSRMDAVEQKAREAIKACELTASRFEDLADAVDYSLGDVPVTAGQKLMLEFKRTIKTGVRSGLFFSVVVGIGFGIRAVLK